VSLFTGWVAFPIALLLVVVGIGLFVEALARVRVERGLLVPLGIAGLIVLVQPLTMVGATPPITVPLVVAAAVSGYATSLPWRRPARVDAWPLVTAAAVFAVFTAPFVFSGEPTLGGYLKIDDTAS
jgi:hypothetical protein